MGNAVVVSTVSLPFRPCRGSFDEIGVPKDVLQVVPGLCDVDEALMAHPGRQIMLAGSAEDGKSWRKLRPRTRLTMVLGVMMRVLCWMMDPKVIAKDLFDRVRS